MIGLRAIRPCSIGERQRKHSNGRSGLVPIANTDAGDVLKPVPDTGGVPDGHRFSLNLSARCNENVKTTRPAGNNHVASAWRPAWADSRRLHALRSLSEH